jgi:release factor glutamine methyltransferase
LIVSNPPYIADSEAPTLQREVREHEPRIALFAGPTGLEIYARLIGQAELQLARGGLLILELGYGAAERVREMTDASEAWRDIAITDDLAGIPRVLATELRRRA